jgi:hypothetical protein
MKPSVHRILAAMLLSLAPFPAVAASTTCLDCHEATLRQLQGPSHHVQGITPDGRHCYACHWEADADGAIDARFHRGSSPAVDLVVWQEGVRPSRHDAGTTAVAFTPSAIGTSGERSAVAGITGHCLSCHNDATGRTATFPGDPNTPQSYAWDDGSIDSRYSRRETAPWGKYSTARTNRKQTVVKALSAHGNAAANEGGWQPGAGYDGEQPRTRGGAAARNVECFDCHNSHGSAVSGVTSSYRTTGNGQNGGILKQTTAGQGGYPMTYQPSVNSYGRSNNPFNAGAGLCFDCHETPAPGKTPWGYMTTFGASQPVLGYKDTPGFGPGAKGSAGRFSNRHGREEIASSHLKAGTPLSHTPMGTIDGLCTPCHDPHGISRRLGENAAYAIPLLKGSWLTSPYREDGPPTGVPGRSDSGIPARSSFNSVNRQAGSNFTPPAATPPRSADYNTTNRDAGANFAAAGATPPRDGGYNSVNRQAGSNFTPPAREFDANRSNRDANSNFTKSGMGSPREPMPGMMYNVDRNTFGAQKHIAEADQTFAGLCLRCHPKEKLTGTDEAGVIHRTVKGWGNNKEHAFPCSKCHQAHNSGLPRLMQTNCFEQGPGGLRENSGIAWLPYGKQGTDAGSGKKPKNAAPVQSNKIIGCHVKQFGKAAADSKGGTWNDVTSW